MSRNYKFYNKEGLYFVSFATVYWIDVFVRQIYLDILVDSVNYCRTKKGMELYCYCFMQVIYILYFDQLIMIHQVY